MPTKNEQLLGAMGAMAAVELGKMEVVCALLVIQFGDI